MTLLKWFCAIATGNLLMGGLATAYEVDDVMFGWTNCSDREAIRSFEKIHGEEVWEAVCLRSDGTTKSYPFYPATQAQCESFRHFNVYSEKNSLKSAFLVWRHLCWKPKTHLDCSKEIRAPLMEFILNRYGNEEGHAGRGCQPGDREDIEGPSISKVTSEIYLGSAQLPLSCGVSWKIQVNPVHCTILNIEQEYIE